MNAFFNVSEIAKNDSPLKKISQSFDAKSLSTADLDRSLAKEISSDEAGKEKKAVLAADSAKT